MIRRVNAVVLFVQNLDTMMQFYRDKLGLEPVFSDAVSYAFQLEGQDFALVERSAGVKMLNEDVLSLARNSGNQVMMCVDVDDVDSVYKALQEKGVSFIKAPIDQAWGWRTAYLADPEGNLWEFRQAIASPPS